jgi:predicted nucleic acid-binding protein
MKFLPDTSFLCALYSEQENSSQARDWYAKLSESFGISAAVMFEFRQSVRLQTFLHRQDRTKGFARKEAEEMLLALESDLECGAVTIVPADWPAVLLIAERVSAAHIVHGGHRSWDVLHVATALHLGSQTLLSLDFRQRALAAANGLKVAP